MNVLFQHGLGGSEAQVAGLFPNGFERLTLELHGGPPPYSFAAFADALMRFVPPGPFIAGGVSMGAALALRLAHLHPGRVRGLILLRPAWGPGPARANLAPNIEVARMIASGRPFDGSATAQRLADAPDNLASLRGFFARPGFAPVLAAISADDPGLTADDIARMDIPALILSAPRDHIHPKALAEELAALLPRTRHVELPDKALHPDLHRSDAARHIAEFLQGEDYA